MRKESVLCSTMPSASTAALHHLHSLVASPFPLFTGDETSSVRDPTHARQFRLDSDNMAVPDGGTFIAPILSKATTGIVKSCQGSAATAEAVRSSVGRSRQNRRRKDAFAEMASGSGRTTVACRKEIENAVWLVIVVGHTHTSVRDRNC